MQLVEILHQFTVSDYRPVVIPATITTTQLSQSLASDDMPKHEKEVNWKKLTQQQ